MSYELKPRRKAFTTMLEVAIASFIILSFLGIFLFVDNRVYENQDLDKTVYDSFEYFYMSGDLGDFAVSGNVSGLNESFRDVVPAFYDIDVGMRNSTVEIRPELSKNRDIYAYQYLVSGSDTVFSPAVFTLYIW